MHTVVLVHGGLWEDMTAARFWRAPGIVGGLERAGLHVLAPDRPRRAPTWTAEADHLLAALPPQPVTLIAASNGCSAAVRLALAHPGRAARLLLAWPATANDPAVDARTREGLAAEGATPPVIAALLTGGSLRGVTDEEFVTLTLPVAVLPSAPANPPHQRRTVDSLLRFLPQATELPGCPEPPRPTFPPHAETFIRSAATFAGARAPA